MENKPEQPPPNQPAQPPLNHLEEYKVTREEIAMYQREMHLTWLWAIIPAGAVYTWLPLHTSELSTLGHKFGDVFWGLGCQGIIRQGLELCHQFPQFDACEPPFEWLGDLFIV